jgi:hypothetical protein
MACRCRGCYRGYKARQRREWQRRILRRNAEIPGPGIYGQSLRIHPPYYRTGVIPKAHLHKIGVAVQPPCLDTNHPSSNDTPAPVQVARIDGVSPRIAVAALSKGNVYIL